MEFYSVFTVLCQLLCLWDSLSYYVYQIHSCRTIAFFFNAVKCFIVWINHNLLLFSTVIGYLGCFQFGAIVNKSAIDILVHVFDECYHWFGGFISRSRITISLHTCMFRFSTHRQIFFQNGFIKLHSHLQCEILQLFIILSYLWYCQSVFLNLWF